jgi:hypothetical protein
LDYAYDEDDYKSYKSMWADISQNTAGAGTGIVVATDEDMTDYSGIFH